MRIYLDLVVLLNFLVDFLLLLAADRLSGFPAQWKRLFLAAALGGVYSGACLMPGFHFLGSWLWRAVSLGVMASIAFGWNRAVLKRGAVFLLLSMALGGMALGIEKNNFLSLVLTAGGMWLLCKAAFGGVVGQQEYVPITLRYGENSLSLIALRDSGNTLRDPITGEPVLVIGSEAAQTLTGLTQVQLQKPMETMALHPLSGLRLIPYQAVGRGAGMLLALRFENVRIGSWQQSALVAFAPEGLGNGNMYQALTGGVI